MKKPINKIELKETLVGENISLRKHFLESAPEMFNSIHQDRLRLREFLPWVDLTKKEEDTIDYIKDSHRKWKELTLFDYSIFQTDSKSYLGNIGVHTINWEDNCCEIGYWIVGKYEGKGFISNAVQALEKHLFEVGFNRVEIRCSGLNKKSSNVPRNNNYILEGTLRENAIELGKYRDTMIFSKLKSDFIKK